MTLLPARVHDLTGRRFGRLVVVRFARRTRGRTIWLCRCDCGRDHLVRAGALVGGQTRSCGCIRVHDLIGERFGRLEVVALAEPRTACGHTRWICRCDCGESATVNANNLRSGNTRSCGCIRQETSRQQLEKNIATSGLRRGAARRPWARRNAA